MEVLRGALVFGEVKVGFRGLSFCLDMFESMGHLVVLGCSFHLIKHLLWFSPRFSSAFPPFIGTKLREKTQENHSFPGNLG